MLTFLDLKFRPVRKLSEFTIVTSNDRGIWYFSCEKKKGAQGSTPLTEQDEEFRDHSAGCPTALPSLFSDAMIDSRSGFTTKRASPTTMKFMIAATANTPCQLPV
jgi:hypothetical protein